MDFTLPLDKMTTAEKLALMEVIWDDLCRTPEDIPSPAWHAEVLAAREKQIQDGQAKFIDFEEMCERIRKETKCET
jgi:putative addiction module component (TIGR02574 family)